MSLILPFDCLQYIGDVGDTVVRYKLSCTCKELNQRMQKYKHVTVIANKLRSKSQFGLSYYEAKKFRGDTMRETNEMLSEHAIPTNWNHLNIVLNEEEPSPDHYTVNRCHTEEVTSPDGRFLRQLEMAGEHIYDILSIITAISRTFLLGIDVESLLSFETYELFEKSRIIQLADDAPSYFGENIYLVNRYRLIIRVDRSTRFKAKDSIAMGDSLIWQQMPEEEKRSWREEKIQRIMRIRRQDIGYFISGLSNDTGEMSCRIYWIPEKSELHVVFPLSAIRE